MCGWLCVYSYIYGVCHYALDLVCICCLVILFVCYILVFFFFFKQKTAYEMRISDWSSDVCSSDLLGPETVNPWDTRRSPGASSGGTAAAIAAGVVPLGIGSDGGGSIRIPSAACGLVGLFPTPGRIPDTGSFSYGRVASMGPMARDIRDLAITMDVLRSEENPSELQSTSRNSY